MVFACFPFVGVVVGCFAVDFEWFRLLFGCWRSKQRVCFVLFGCDRILVVGFRFVGLMLVVTLCGDCWTLLVCLRVMGCVYFVLFGVWFYCAGGLMWMDLFLEFGLDLVYLRFMVAFGRLVLYVLDCGGWCCRGWLCSCLVCLCCAIGFAVVSVVIVAIVSVWFWLVVIIDFVRSGIGLFVNSVVYIY